MNKVSTTTSTTTQRSGCLLLVFFRRRSTNYYWLSVNCFQSVVFHHVKFDGVTFGGVGFFAEKKLYLFIPQAGKTHYKCDYVNSFAT